MDRAHYMRTDRRENQQMICILWSLLERVDPEPEYVYRKGTNGLLRRLINYLDKTHPGWNDTPKFQLLSDGIIDGMNNATCKI